MSLFRKAGKKFEEKKQALISGKGTEYVCRSCQETVAEEYDHCPHCGEETVEQVG